MRPVTRFLVLCGVFLLSSCDLQTEEEFSAEGLSAEAQLSKEIIFNPLSVQYLKVFSLADCEEIDSTLPEYIQSSKINVTKIRARSLAGGWFSKDISDAPLSLDLANLGCSLAGGFMKYFLPVGTYDHLRFETEATGVVEHDDGKSFSLSVPSGEQTGIKVFFNPPIVVKADSVTVCLFKYDPGKSIHGIPANNPAHYHFKPVVRAQCGPAIVGDIDDEDIPVYPQPIDEDEEDDSEGDHDWGDFDSTTYKKLLLDEEGDSPEGHIFLTSEL